MFGIDNFCAVINPPQACNLAVGSGEKRVMVENGAPLVRTVLKVTLSSDRRVVEEDLAAKFLESVKKYLENPQYIY